MAKKKKQRNREWAKSKKPDPCCTNKNLGELERLQGTEIKFRRCNVCNRRYFEKAPQNGQAKH